MVKESSSVTIKGVKLSATQTATLNTFDPNAALMAGKETDGALSFKNVVAYVKVTPIFNCSKISLVSNNSSDVLSSTVDITLNYSDTDKSWTPSVAVSSGASDASNTVSIEGNITGNKTYYIAVLPGTLSNGFRVVLTPTTSFRFSDNDCNKVKHQII